jgi:hypothetical protein
MMRSGAVRLLHHAHFDTRGGELPFAAPCTYVRYAQLVYFAKYAEQIVGFVRMPPMQGFFYLMHRVYTGKLIIDRSL